MKLAQASDLVMSLKGAGVSVLVLMWAMRKNKRNWSRNQLATYTGWSRPTVATGLERLHLRGLVTRTNAETWQLSDMGHQLNFDDFYADQITAENMESRTTSESKILTLSGGGFKENHDDQHDMESLKPLLIGVKNFDSRANHEPSTYGLDSLLISYGAAPKTAISAITTALEREPNPERVRLRVLYWRAYTATQDGLKHPGNLIAARVGSGTDTPADFTSKDVPWKLNGLQLELENLERSLNNDHEPNEQ